MQSKVVIFLLFILFAGSLFTSNLALAEENLKLLPLSSYGEVEIDSLRAQGNKIGWPGFYSEYKDKYGLEVYNTGPYGGYLIFPHLPALSWVESRLEAEANQESEDWADIYYQNLIDSYIPRILFQIFIISGKPIEAKNLIIEYQDNTGLKKKIAQEYIEVNEELSGQEDYYYLNSIIVLSPETADGELRWFDLSLMKDNSSARVNFRWEFAGNQ